jgi:hypothetical protein
MRHKIEEIADAKGAKLYLRPSADYNYVANIRKSNVMKALRRVINVCFTTEFSKHCL